MTGQESRVRSSIEQNKQESGNVQRSCIKKREEGSGFESQKCIDSTSLQNWGRGGVGGTHIDIIYNYVPVFWGAICKN